MGLAAYLMLEFYIQFNQQMAHCWLKLRLICTVNSITCSQAVILKLPGNIYYKNIWF